MSMFGRASNIVTMVGYCVPSASKVIVLVSDRFTTMQRLYPSQLEALMMAVSPSYDRKKQKYCNGKKNKTIVQ